MHAYQPSTQPGTSYDVVVVGARASGASTAMLLARRRLRVLVIDQGAPGADTLSTHALMRGGVLQLSRWGLLDDVIAAGTPPVRRATFRHGDERTVINIQSQYGVDALYAPRRTVLDSMLVRAAVDAGAEVHHHTSLTALVERRGRVVGVRVLTKDGRHLEISAPLVIGADGVRSTVARRVDAPFTRVGNHSAAVTYGYWTDLVTDGYQWTFRRDACSGIIPTNNGEVCVFASAPRRRIGRGSVDVITDVVAAGSPDLAARLLAATPPRGTRTWTGLPGYLRRSSGPGWALVGDAGYFKDPISAHGLTDVLRDAELLARAVLAGEGRQTDLDESLEHYEATRARLSIPLFDVVDRIASHQWDNAEIASLLLKLSSAMTDEIELLADLEPNEIITPNTTLPNTIVNGALR